MSSTLARAFRALIFALALLLTFQQLQAVVVAPEIVPQLGHSDYVLCLAVTPDGRFMVSGSTDKTIKLWDIASGALMRTFEGHLDDAKSVAITPNGRHMVSGSNDKTIKIWDLATGSLLRTFDGHKDAVYSVAITPDGRHIVSGSIDGTIKLWDVATGALVRSFKGHQDRVYAIALTRDGKHIVSGGNVFIELWDLATGALLRSFERHLGETYSVAVTPDSKHIVSGGPYGSVILWELDTGRIVRTVGGGFFGHQGSVNSVVVTPDGRHIVSGSDDYRIKLWDLETGVHLRTYAGHGGWLSSVGVTSDGRYILSASEDKTLRFWDLERGTQVRTFDEAEGAINRIVITSDGRYAASASGDKTIKLWDLAKGILVRTLEGHKNWVISVAVSSDSEHIVSGSDDKTVKLWSLATGALVRTLEGHEGAVFSVALTPDGRQIVSGSEDKTIKLWSLSTGDLVRTFEGHKDIVLSVAVTPDGQHIVSGSVDKTIKLWDLATGALVRTYEGHENSISSIALTPDGRHVVSASGDKTIRLWDLATGELVRTFKGHDNWIFSVAVTPEGQYIVTGSSDNTIKLWNLATGVLVRTLKDPQVWVSATATTPDGRHILSGSIDGTIRIFDVASGRSLAMLVGNKDDGTLALTSDGFFTIDGENMGTSKLKVVDGLKVYDVRQFYQALYRPELVSELLKGDPEGKYELAAGNLNLRKVLESGPPPRVELKRTERIGDSVRVTVEITNQGGGIGKVEWRVDDVLLAGERGMTPISEGEEVLTEVRSFPLTAAGNGIAITAYNRAGLITAVPLVEKVNGHGIAESEQAKLFILAVGIDDYAQSSLRLSYAVNDAEAFSSRFKMAAEELGLFKQVSVRKLINAEVTRDELDRAFTELAAQIGPEDKFVFFAAGHGKVYKDRYYFYPQDLRFGAGDAITSQGIDQDTWQTWFSRIPALASVLIYDTCEAGQMTTAMRGSEDIRTAIDLLKNATGRSILAATTAEDAAREGFENHGVFTYALLKALSEGDQNGDGRIEVIELGQYVERAVPVLTNQRWGIAQRPRFTIQANFPIAGRVAPDDTGVAFIPKAATHVIIKQVTIAAADRGAPAHNGDLPPGTTVRLLKLDGDRALIAREGQELGFVPATSLAPLN